MVDFSMASEDTADAADQLAVRVRTNFALPHMCGAKRFSIAVARLEEENGGASLGAFWDEILHNAIASVMCSVSSLEAYANELFLERDDVFPGHSKAHLDRLWNEIERKSLKDKFQLALFLRGKQKFGEEDPLLTNLAIAIELRNALVHFKPEWDTEADRHRKLSAKLRGKFEPSPFLDDALIFPRRWATSACTHWVIRSCLDFALEFETLAELQPKYPSI